MNLGTVNLRKNLDKIKYEENFNPIIEHIKEAYSELKKYPQAVNLEDEINNLYLENANVMDSMDGIMSALNVFEEKGEEIPF